MEKINNSYQIIAKMFPNARCELNYSNNFELLVAVVLSAQTTDVKVNKVSEQLFYKYSTPQLLSKAKVEDVEAIIKPLGLYKAKAINIIELSKKLLERNDGNVPSTLEELITLPGVGRKTANVVLSEAFDIPAIAVDTHVLRVSNRLGFSTSDDPKIVEQDLMAIFPKEIWKSVHLKLLFFGRYFCTAKTPHCEECPFRIECIK